MRKEIRLYTEFKGLCIKEVHVRTKAKAQKMVPSAVKIVRVFGGWFAFESLDDYCRWLRLR